MDGQLPFISIVVPTHGRPGPLAGCLAALARSDYPSDRFEVIVVDDGSPEPACGVVAPFRDRIDLTLVEQAWAGPAMARNAGAARARGELLAFTDDDCAPAPDWLSRLATRAAQWPGCALGGRTLNALPGNPCSAASQMLIDYLYGYYNADPVHARFLASNNLALPRADFRALGGFGPQYVLVGAEDRDLCDRWLCSGRRIVYAPEAVIHHAHPLTLRSFWQQHYVYGRGAALYRYLHARRRRERVRLESWRFYAQLLRFPFRQRSWPDAARLGVLLLVAQAANAAGYWRERKAAISPWRAAEHSEGWNETV